MNHGFLNLVGAAFLGLALCSAPGARADTAWDRDTRVLGDAIRAVPDEVADIVMYPANSPTDFWRYAAFVGALVVVDKPLTQLYQDSVEASLKDFKIPDSPLPTSAITAGTDGWLLLGVSGTYLGGLLADDPHTQKVGIAATKAIGYSYLLDHVALKTIAGRNRPLASLSGGQASGSFTSNPYDFFNSRGGAVLNSDAQGSSFLSFHVTMWFAVAKVYERAYDNYWVPYSLTALGLASNIQGHRHWVSDMVGGALLGTLIGDSVFKQTFAPSERGFSLYPPVNGALGLQLVYRY